MTEEQKETITRFQKNIEKKSEQQYLKLHNDIEKRMSDVMKLFPVTDKYGGCAWILDPIRKALKDNRQRIIEQISEKETRHIMRVAEEFRYLTDQGQQP